MGTEGLTLDFTPESIEAIADAAVKVNSTVENIGARRLQTIMERLVEDISFNADEKTGETIRIDAAYVADRVGKMAGRHRPQPVRALDITLIHRRKGRAQSRPFLFHAFSPSSAMARTRARCSGVAKP